MTAKVGERFACPECQERRADELVWQGDDGNVVRCSTCGTEYNPLTGEVILEAESHNVAFVILKERDSQATPFSLETEPKGE